MIVYDSLWIRLTISNHYKGESSPLWGSALLPKSPSSKEGWVSPGFQRYLTVCHGKWMNMSDFIDDV
jgi:hypothetical protein